MDTKQMIFGTGVSSCKDYGGLKKVVGAALENGINSFDTAPSYHTEELLGKVLKEAASEMGISRRELFIQTKIDAWQMQESDGHIEKYVENVLGQMGLEYIDSLLVHWPVPEYFDSTWECLVRLRERGVAGKIGVCNVRLRHLEKYEALDFRPEIIQIERNPLRTCGPELEFCRERGITVQAYSPLCKMDERIRDSKAVRTISERHHKSLGQTVLRWHIDTGAVPVFTSTKPERVREYADIFDFKLSKEEIREISLLNIDYKMYLESVSCPGL